MGNIELLELTTNVVSDFHLIERETSDVIEQAEALPLWSQDYTQLGKGVFSGSIKSIHHRGIQIFAEKMNRAVDQIASAPQDCFVIGLPTVVEGDATWGLLPIKPHSLITLNKNAELYFRTSAKSEIIAAVIPVSRLTDFARKIDWPSFDDAMHSIKPVEALPKHISDQLLSTLTFGLHAVYGNSDGLEQLNHWADFEEELLHACIQALMYACKNAHPYYFDHKIPRYIVNRVRHLTLSKAGFPLGIDEICDHLRIRRRTLNSAFARALGITPLTYMRNLKLHKVRIDLTTYPNNHASIAEAASKWGFVHMSLFSRYYRELFGECPIETLQRVKTNSD